MGVPSTVLRAAPMTAACWQLAELGLEAPRAGRVRTLLAVDWALAGLLGGLEVCVEGHLVLCFFDIFIRQIAESLTGQALLGNP